MYLMPQRQHQLQQQRQLLLLLRALRTYTVTIY